MSDEVEARFLTALDRQLDWLKRDALPRWARDGVDPRGGFFERIGQDGRPVVDLPRRARVVARQTYVFAIAAERGWGDYGRQAAHGASEIFGRCLLANGLSLCTYAPDGPDRDERFDSYDQAFVLFALAAVARFLPDRRRDAWTAGERLLTVLRERFRHPEMGFEEALPRRLPLLQNPHMHLLEACLAFAALPGASSIWHDQADELVELAKARLAEADTGAIHEFFDGDWRPIVDARGGWIEPGHQFEWAWLLWQWQDRAVDAAAGALASRLFRIGTDYGLGQSGHVVDAIDARLAPREPSLRLWPQTERLKACIAVAERSDGEERARALAGATGALDGFDLFSGRALPGLWYDRLTQTGETVQAAAPASSLYHVVCSLDYAERYASHWLHSEF